MNRTAFLGLVLTIAAAISGCASGPSFNDMKASIPPLRSDQGRVYFYRPSSLGAAVQPSIYLNGAKVGEAVPVGFFYVDQAPGNCEVSVTTEAENKLTFVLDPAQTRYVRLEMELGFFVGHVVPQLVDDTEGMKEIQDTSFADPAKATSEKKADDDSAPEPANSK